MKLPKWMPRLNRKQKIARNLLLALALVLLTWGIRGFEAPTVGLAVRWRAAEYGLDAPEIVYRADWKRDKADVVLRWEDGRLASGICYRAGWFSRRMGEYYFMEPEESVTVILSASRVLLTHEDETLTLYCHAALPEALRAEGSLRLRTICNNRPFDETYPLEAVPNEHGIYCFQAAPRCTGVRKNGEEAAFWQYGSVLRESTGTDFACEVAFSFYDGEGNLVEAYEKELWNSFPGGKDR